jgi:hypothetical protein
MTSFVTRVCLRLNATIPPSIATTDAPTIAYSKNITSP